MKSLNGGSYPLVENGILETLGHLKTLFLPLLSSVHRALGGLSYKQYCPCQSVCIFNYSMPIYALSHNRYIIMYMCQRTISLKKGISAIFFTSITFERDAFYVRQSK